MEIYQTVASQIESSSFVKPSDSLPKTSPIVPSVVDNFFAKSHASHPTLVKLFVEFTL